MSEPFIGQIQMFGFNFAPQGWALCNGQLLAISQYAALFSLLGTTYGGDGVHTFGLPNLQSRVPVHQGTGTGLSPYAMGQSAGAESVALNQNQMPKHTHSACASTISADQASPAAAIWAAPVDSTGGAGTGYTKTTSNANMSQAAIGMTGGNQAHPNIQPYLCINFCIALQGVFPTRS